MKAWLASEIITKVENDLDLNDETFITPEEMLGYLNEVIDSAEAIIHNLYVDYFLTKDVMSLVAGTAEYDMPSDIYSNKIRHMQFDNGTKKYVIQRIKPIEIPCVESNDYFMYNVTNHGTDGIKQVFHPTPDVDDSTSVTRWYIRNAKRIEATADAIDIPEFANFLITGLKVKCMEKELHPMLQKAMEDETQQAELMRRTLATMVPDGDIDIDPDMSFYDDFYDFGGDYY